MNRPTVAVLASKPSGFTLLEMVVVLMLIGLMAAVAVPSIGRQLGERTKQAELEVMLAEIVALPAQAMFQGRTIRLPETLRGPIAEPINVPDQWELTFQPPLTISDVPACSATTITIKHASAQKPEAVYAIEQGTCNFKVGQLDATP